MKVNGKKLKLAMMRACMSQRELAEKSGCGLTVISKTCGEKSMPTIATIGKIAKALGVDPTEIIDMED